MRKQLTTIAIAFATAVPSALAGGLVTNTNQNAAYLRLMSQDGIIDLSGLYANPAGTAFLKPGHHFSLNLQNAKQSRNIETSFPLFALNGKNPNTTHRFEGDAYAPVIPSFHYSYNTEGKWSFNLNFALGGGGGKCEFDKGLGSFEALYSSTIVSSIRQQIVQALTGLYSPQFPEQAGEIANQIANTTRYGYDLSSYMKGRNYQFHITAGGTYKVLDNLSVSLGLRAVYASNNYNGFVEDVNASYDIPANATYGFPGLQGSVNLKDNSISLNCDQTGWGVAPIIGVDYKVGNLNLGLKYEFKTRMRLKNKAANSLSAENIEMLSKFGDGKKVAEDSPALITVGAQYSILPSVRVMAGYHHYFDTDTKQYMKDFQTDTNEYLFGAEWNINKYIEVSAGGQRTIYGNKDAGMNDISFTVNSWTAGFGIGVNVAENIKINAAYFETFYDDYNKISGTGMSDTFTRSNRVIGIGADFTF